MLETKVDTMLKHLQNYRSQHKTKLKYEQAGFMASAVVRVLREIGAAPEPHGNLHKIWYKMIDDYDTACCQRNQSKSVCLLLI